MRIVMDTSSLISLEVVRLIGKAMKELSLEILVPDAVVKELKEMSKFKDREAKAARRIMNLLDSGKITEVNIKNRKKTEKLLSADVNIGEAECFILCIEKSIKNLIMDDVDAMYALEAFAKMHDISVKISVAVISQLVKEAKISKKSALDYVKSISKIREWEGGVLELLAKKYFE